MTHAEACICLYRPVVVVPAFAGGRKCGGACQPAGAGGSAPVFVPRGGNRLVAEGGESRHQRIYKSSCPPRIGARRRFLVLPPRLAAAGVGKNSPAGEKFSCKFCRKIKFIVSLTNLKKKVAAGNLLR